jgi:NAD(P)-dependent dehydrogenase (short-subunit alcohol dehydrogenase family)
VSVRAGVAVITGGSAGIGLALAARLAERGMHVLLVARDAGRLHAANRAIPAGTVLAADVASEGGRERIVEAVAALGRLDLLAHAARAGASGADQALDTGEVARRCETTLLAPVALTRALWPLLRASAGSLLALDAPPGPGAADAAARGALVGWARVLRIQGLREGVAVSILHAAPGAPAGKAADAALRALDHGRAESWSPPSARLAALARAVAPGRAATRG